MPADQTSPFLTPGCASRAQALAVLHLRRDELLAVKLLERDEHNSGYSEGPVINTRFGSFPHSTLIGLPWGSQVRASVVDTGSRGRKKQGRGAAHQAGKGNTRKRKRAAEPSTPEDAAIGDNGLHDDGGGDGDDDANAPLARAPVTAATGFTHLLPPTPESWTASLPHRTQVVYTPDYSYILHRLRVRPGSVLIEAGAGSGSFTHAAARAVFNGYSLLKPSPSSSSQPPSISTQSAGEDQRRRSKRTYGKVWSYEFHEQRIASLRREIQDHGLEGIVSITQRDVYKDGFLLHDEGCSTGVARVSPGATAIFLDLPAPWLALRHLARAPISSSVDDRRQDSSSPAGPPASVREEEGEDKAAAEAEAQEHRASANHNDDESRRPSSPLPETNGASAQADFLSPLNPNVSVHLCCFSPCVEQVQRTLTTLRELGWVDIEMVTVAQKRLEIRRERCGLQEAGQRGAQVAAATVDEALDKLREVEGRIRQQQRHAAAAAKVAAAAAASTASANGCGDSEPHTPLSTTTTTQQQQQQLRTADEKQPCMAPRKLYKEGRLVHRVEPEIKSHTSYLVFALLPRLWTPEDEERAARNWPLDATNSLEESQSS